MSGINWQHTGQSMNFTSVLFDLVVQIYLYASYLYSWLGGPNLFVCFVFVFLTWWSKFICMLNLVVRIHLYTVDLAVHICIFDLVVHICNFVLFVLLNWWNVFLCLTCWSIFVILTLWSILVLLTSYSALLIFCDSTNLREYFYLCWCLTRQNTCAVLWRLIVTGSVMLANCLDLNFSFLPPASKGWGRYSPPPQPLGYTQKGPGARDLGKNLWLGYPPPLDVDGHTCEKFIPTPSGQDWGIRLAMTWLGYPLPPARTAERVLATWRAVCPLRSRRRTFLFCCFFFKYPEISTTFQFFPCYY